MTTRKFAALPQTSISKTQVIAPDEPLDVVFPWQEPEQPAITKEMVDEAYGSGPTPGLPAAPAPQEVDEVDYSDVIGVYLRLRQANPFLPELEHVSTDPINLEINPGGPHLLTLTLNVALPDLA